MTTYRSLRDALNQAGEAIAKAEAEIAEAGQVVDEADRATPKLACPHCGHLYSRVINSRGLAGDGVVRRRRECSRCQARYSTAERVIVGSLTEKSA